MDVIATSAPNPFLFEVVGSGGVRAAARVKLAVPAAPGDTVHDAGGGDSVGERRLARRNRENRAEHGRVVDCRAVPFLHAELVLTFGDAFPGASAHVHHVVGVEHAQLLLTRREAFDLGAQRHRLPHGAQQVALIGKRRRAMNAKAPENSTNIASRPDENFPYGVLTSNFPFL